MSEHLSALQLDEIAAGLSAAPEHVAACSQCASRLEALRAQSAVFLARPEAKRQLEALAPAPRRRSFLWLAVPLAAGIALSFAWPRQVPEDRLKGSPTVVLLDGAGNAVSHAAPGTQLTLAVGAAGFSRVQVFAVDAEGKQESLYSGAVAAGARVPLTQLVVTPGDVTVTATFEGGAEPRSVSVKLSVP